MPGEGATGNASFGYFPRGSQYYRINFSNDLASPITRGTASSTQTVTAGTSSQINGLSQPPLANSPVQNFPVTLFGYWAGGLTSNTSIIDRINYANDTATALSRTRLTTPSPYYISGTGNGSFGYFGGGTSISKVDRVDYSNDTATASTRGPLSVGRYGMGATSNASFGYFASGSSPLNTPVLNVDRIDYSNDTATASPKGPLSVARGFSSATGSSSFGYFGGGTPGPVSTIDRVDYSNDTATASVRGPLSLARYGTGSSSAAANGLPQ